MTKRKPPHPNSLANLRKGGFANSEQARAASQKGLETRRAKAQRKEYWREVHLAIQSKELPVPPAIDVLRILLAHYISIEQTSECNHERRQARDQMVHICTKLLPYEEPRLQAIEMRTEGLEHATDAELRALAMEMGIVIDDCWEEEDSD